MVGLQRRVQRHIAQRIVQRVFRAVQQSRAFQFLIVGAAHEIGNGIQHGARLVDVSGSGIGVHHLEVFAVGLVAGHGQSRDAPHRIRHRLVFSQIGQRNDVACVGGRSRLVGHPYLHAVDGDAGGDVGQCAHGGIIVAAEILREEEMAVLLIVGGIHLKRGGLRAALACHARARRLLLRYHRLQFQFAELQVGADTKQLRGTSHQRRIAGKRNISRLHQLDDFVFLAVVFQFQVLRVEVTGGIGVIVQIHVHLVAHLAVHAQVDFLVEVHVGGLAVADGQRRVVDVLHGGPELQFGGSLRLHAHTARAENLLCRSQVEMHVGERKFLLAFLLIDFIVFLAVEIAAQFLLRPLSELVGSHHEGGSHIARSHFRTDNIGVERVVVFHLLTDV